MRNLLIGLAILYVAAGCAREYSGGRRYPLSGTVRADGQPIDSGIISFIPADAKAQRVSGGPITDGVYSVPEPMGANEGEYRVEIRWQKKTGRKEKDSMTGDMIDVLKEGLPKKYHQESELKIQVSDGSTIFDFDLKSQ